MGKADISVNNWLEEKERFADLFNGVIFEGKQVIQPNEAMAKRKADKMQGNELEHLTAEEIYDLAKVNSPERRRKGGGGRGRRGGTAGII